MLVENVNGTELRFKNPGALLLVVIGFAFWGVGFLDLLGHTSAEPDVFGLYSLPFFVLIILYACTSVIWFALFFNSNLLLRVGEGVKYIQRDTRLAVAAMAGIGIALWVIFEWDRWVRLPGLQVSAFGFTVLAFLILLLTNWDATAAQQKWRKFIAYPLAFLVVVEIILQVLVRLEVLPVVNRIGGHFYPYERIYYRGETVQSGFANRYGWYYPDVKLDNKKKHILIVGGSYVQALQVQPEQHFGRELTRRIDDGGTDLSQQVDIIPIGMPGFGLSSFLFEDAIKEIPNIVNTDEIIIVFHLGDDFQSPSVQDNGIRYLIGDEGEVEVDPEDAKLRHDLTHYFLRSYMSTQLVETVRSNYLTPKVIAGLVRGDGGETRSSAAPGSEFDFPRFVSHVSDTYMVTEAGHAGIKTTDLEVVPGGNNFMFMQGGNEEMQQAVLIAENMLAKAQEIASANGVTLRVVTVPMFPEAFYKGSGQWEPTIGTYDLLQPERALIEIAQKHGISILPMGQYLLQDQLTVEEIRELYRSNEEGGFTAKGHEYFAEAIYACFYSNAGQDFCSQ